MSPPSLHIAGHNPIGIGNDFGSQTGLIVGRTQLERHVLPGTRRLITQAKAHGLKVIHHSCGAIGDLIGLIVCCDSLIPQSPDPAASSAIGPHRLLPAPGRPSIR